jgi:hypothetical protein
VMIDFMEFIATLSPPTLFVRKLSGPFRTNDCRAPISNVIDNTAVCLAGSLCC